MNNKCFREVKGTQNGPEFQKVLRTLADHRVQFTFVTDVGVPADHVTTTFVVVDRQPFVDHLVAHEGFTHFS